MSLPTKKMASMSKREYPPFICTSHKTTATYLCTAEGCKQRLLCQTCLKNHSKIHENDIHELFDVIGEEIQFQVEKEIFYFERTQNLKKGYALFLETIRKALSDLKININKHIDEIYEKLRVKINEIIPDFVINEKEFQNMKEVLSEKRTQFCDPKLPQNMMLERLEDYISYFKQVTSKLDDLSSQVNRKGASGDEILLEVPTLDHSHFHHATENLKNVVNSLYFKICNIYTPSTNPDDISILNNFNSPVESSFQKYKITFSPPDHVQEISVPHMSKPTTRDNLKGSHQASDQSSTNSFRSASTTASLQPFVYDADDPKDKKLPTVGPIKQKDGSIYHGQMKKNKKHGRGKLIFKDQRVYEGYFKDDKMQGKGRMVHPNGDVYEGEWKNNMAHGKGKYEKIDGWFYIGDWVEDVPHGKGIEKWTNGSSYEGEFCKGKRHGKGTLKYLDGSIYTGDFTDGKIEGHGQYISADGTTYEGSWRDNKKDGIGIMKYPDGRIYRGEYKNDQKEGYGVLDFKDGKRYEGYWKAGKQDGKGKLYLGNGEVIDTVWRAGKPETSPGKIQDTEKSGLDSFQNLSSPGRKREVTFNENQRRSSRESIGDYSFVTRDKSNIGFGKMTLDSIKIDSNFIAYDDEVEVGHENHHIPRGY